MDPNAFVRVSVASVALKMPLASKAWVDVLSASSSCFCEIKLSNFPVQIAPVPLVSLKKLEPDYQVIAACFYLDEPSLRKLLTTSCFTSSLPCLEITVYASKQGSSCRVSSGKVLGKFALPVGGEWAVAKPLQVHSGWVCIEKSKADGERSGAELHLNVTIEPDPRYIFQFDDQPELSPQILQVQGNSRQTIFTCKFSRDRGWRSRNGFLDGSSGVESSKERKERKGWLIIIHDLSGSPVAAASMITPFVPTTGSDCVSRSNPGAWLILRAGPVGEDNWMPWGRLEAWRERGTKGGLGCRFQLVVDDVGVPSAGNFVSVTETVISAQNGGTFLIDTTKFRLDNQVCAALDNPHTSGDFCFSMNPFLTVGGFVMSVSIQGEGKCSKPEVQLAMMHVTCIEDAGAFMALAAAVDLSMDACRPFSKKLRKSFVPSDSCL